MKQLFSAEEQQNLVLIASGKMFEPFEGLPSKTSTTEELVSQLGKSKASIEGQTKKWGTQVKQKIVETKFDKKLDNLLQSQKGNWQNLAKVWGPTEETKSKATSFLKAKLIKIKQSTGAAKQKIQHSELGKKLDQTVKTNLEKGQKSWSKLQNFTKQKQENLNHKVQEIAHNHTQKGFELVLGQDAKAWILQKTKTILPDHDLKSFEELANLGQSSRQKLITKLYPNGNQSFQSFARSFDSGLAIFMNSLKSIYVANLNTSKMNVAKVLVKIAQRLFILSAIYGREIKNGESLFYVACHIFENLNSWATKPDHSPLDSMIIADLYKKQPIDQLAELVREAFEKPDQIFVPLFGVVQVTEFELDIQKIDLVVLNLMENYFHQTNLERAHGKKIVKTELKILQQLLGEYKNRDALKKWAKDPKSGTWLPFIQTVNKRLYNQQPSKLVTVQQASLATYRKIKAEKINLKEAQAQIQKMLG